MIRLSATGAVVSASTDLEQLREQFKTHHYVRLENFIEPELLEFIKSQMDGAEFYERVHDGIASNKELCMNGNAGFGALLLAVNDERLFQFVEKITGCVRIRCFEGRVYRATPNAGHHDSWHNDLGDHRLIGMSINLSRDAYAGGILQIRDRASGEVVSEVENLGVGDAVIFRLSEKLQHRITEVEGANSKSAFAGWFKAQPDFVSLIRQQAKRGREAQRPSVIAAGQPAQYA